MSTPTESPSVPTNPPAESRRRRGETARRAILDAAEALLLRDGLEAVSIRRVAERSGYTAPTLYHHFGDKNGLIDAALEERFREVHAVMAATPRGPDAARYLRDMGMAFVRFAVENPDHYRLLSTKRRHMAGIAAAEACRDLVKDALAELLREGTLATPDLEEAFQILWAMLHGLISLHLMRPDDYELADDLVGTAFDVVEEGLLRRVAR